MKKNIADLPQPVQNAIHMFDLHGKTSMIGSNSIRGNLFGNDYDIEDKLSGSPKQIEQFIHNEFNKSKILMLEFKIQKKNKKFRFNHETINQPLAHLIETCDYMKADLVVPVGDRYAEVSIHYYRNPVKPQIKSLEADVKKYWGKDNMKALKRLYSIYKMEGKNTDNFTTFFNSEYGLLNKIVSDLELLKKIKNLITKEAYEKNLDFIRSTLATTTAPLVLDVKKLRAIVNKASAEFMNKLT
jgi:hypothetical protein